MHGKTTVRMDLDDQAVNGNREKDEAGKRGSDGRGIILASQRIEKRYGKMVNMGRLRHNF